MTDIVQFYIQSVYGLFCVRAFRTRHISHILYFCFKRVFFFRLKEHIYCHKNKRNAGNCRHTLRERSLVTDVAQYHISVYKLRSPRRGNNKTVFTSVEFSA